MTAKLNQILAVLKGVAAQNYSKIGEIDKTLQKPDLFNGFHKDFHRVDDADAPLPPESKRVQKIVREELRQTANLATEWWDLTAKKDWTNCQARANVVLDDGTVLLRDVPVPHLLFLQKQLTDMHTMASRLPILDESENWTYDVNSGIFKSDLVKTHRNKKVPQVLTLVQPTDHHPGQAQVYMDDVLEGHWHTVRHSGAMRKPDRDLLLERIKTYLKAVKQARENANNHDVVDAPRVGEIVFDYLLEGIV